MNQNYEIYEAPEENISEEDKERYNVWIKDIQKDWNNLIKEKRELADSCFE